MRVLPFFKPRKGWHVAGTNLETDSGGGSYVLPKASAETLGGVKVGNNLSIDGDGVLSASGGGSYVLPTASADTLGGVKIGEGVSIDANGVLSATGGGDTLVDIRNNITITPESGFTIELYYANRYGKVVSISVGVYSSGVISNNTSTIFAKSTGIPRVMPEYSITFFGGSTDFSGAGSSYSPTPYLAKLRLNPDGTMILRSYTGDIPANTHLYFNAIYLTSD